ncbi:ethanolamine ammonia-lyase light chain EutC [Nocardia sp. NPDC049707]|uniref:ethanolamine ammonia-lyase light chain EutC n=1 Tax=Nocardia sp. NPDC049707 TaxID=3154735 RepID=UPI00341779B6
MTRYTQDLRGTRYVFDRLVELLAKVPRYSIAPPVITSQARVALGDHIAVGVGVGDGGGVDRCTSGSVGGDSLGGYLPHVPRPGRTDAQYDCVSTIRPPDGLGYRHAAKVVAGVVSGTR